LASDGISNVIMTVAQMLGGPRPGSAVAKNAKVFLGEVEILKRLSL